MPRPERSNSLVPSTASICAVIRLSADCVTPTMIAVREKLPASTSFRNTRIWWIVSALGSRSGNGGFMSDYS